MHHIRLYLIGFLLFTAMPAQAADITRVAGLLEACMQIRAEQGGKEYNEQAYGLCLGYFQGVKNSYDIPNMYSHKGDICFPKNVTWIELIDTFITWAENHPQQQRHLAWVAVINAFKEKYPCGVY